MKKTGLVNCHLYILFSIARQRKQNVSGRANSIQNSSQKRAFVDLDVVFSCESKHLSFLSVRGRTSAPSFPSTTTSRRPFPSECHSVLVRYIRIEPYHLACSATGLDPSRCRPTTALFRRPTRALLAMSLATPPRLSPRRPTPGLARSTTLKLDVCTSKAFSCLTGWLLCLLRIRRRSMNF